MNQHHSSHHSGALGVSAGYFSGSDFPEAFQAARGELGAPHLTPFPTLEERGFAATRTARTISVMADLSADGQPFGWRVRETPSRESVAAESALRSDINVMADAIGAVGRGHRGHTVLSLTGPITLATELKLGNGESSISDHGARRDIAASLSEGIAGIVASLRTAVDGEDLTIRWCEPRMRDALEGKVPTSSGYRTMRAIPRAEARDALAAVARRTQDVGVGAVLDTGGSVPDVDFGRSFDAVTSRPVGRGAGEWEAIAGAVDRGQDVWLGIVPIGLRESTVDTVKSLWSTWRDLGLGSAEIGHMRVEERENLNSDSPAQAVTVLSRIAEVAEGITDLSLE